jgi:transketolase
MNSVKTQDYHNLRSNYGEILSRIDNGKILVFDSEVSNSTGSSQFKEHFPNRFFECFIAEQNMISVAGGVGAYGFSPFVSTFSAFLTRGFDQIRMTQYSETSVNFVGTHVGVSIGEDGPSQMALEDIAMFNSILESEIYYPSDLKSFESALKIMLKSNSKVKYCRVTRGDLLDIYEENTEFKQGDSKLVYTTNNQKPDLTIITGGVCLEESIKACEKLKTDGKDHSINIIDIFCLKPINIDLLLQNIGKSTRILVVEDHFSSGGIYSIILQKLAENKLLSNFQTIDSLSINIIPKSGSKNDLLKFCKIDSESIYNKLKQILN